MDRLAERILRLRPTMKAGPFNADFTIVDDGTSPRVASWNDAFPRPTDAELLAVDLTQPTAEELADKAELNRIKEIAARFETATAAERNEALGKWLRRAIAKGGA